MYNLLIERPEAYFVGIQVYFFYFSFSDLGGSG
jgi:hypothetical protein